jgi:FkbM family methyltransferase
MSSYFILTKPAKSVIYNDKDNDIILLNNKETYILPTNNITYYLHNGLFEKRLIEWCKQFCNKDKIFLDIGAHTGTYSIPLSFFSKEVYAFEPQRDTYYALCGSVSLSNLKNVICYNYGLGSSNQLGKNILKIVSEDGGGSSLHITEQHSVLREEVIEIKTLDSLNLNNIGFIKMDVENNELYVLQGATKTLEKSGFPPIIFECNQTNIELFNFIEKNLKYNIIQINGVDNMFLAEKSN